MPRLFAGLEIPETWRARLARVKSPLPGAKWVEPANYHITLRFAGDVDNRIAREIVHELDAVTSDVHEIRLEGLGTFGGNDPRSIFAAVDGGESLASLARQVERAFRNAGLPPEGRAFKPHITLARLRACRVEAVARILQRHAVLGEAPHMVTRVVLYSSKPVVGGGPYVAEALFPLAGAWDPDEAEADDERW